MTDMLNVKNIVVPTDFSDASYSAFALARNVADKYNATIHLLHVKEVAPPVFDNDDVDDFLNEDAINNKLAELSAQFRNGSERSVTAHVREGKSHEAIIEYSREINAELIVIATHGRTGVLDTLLGGVAQQIIKHSKCPVLVTSPQNRTNI